MTDWAIGDLALCVDARSCPSYRWGGLCAGRVYSVDAVTVDTGPRGFSALHGKGGGVGLAFADAPTPSGTYGWDARRFVKVTPEEEDEFDREVIELMKGGKVKA